MSTKLYHTIIKGRFIDRPNRFIAHVEIHGKVETCHMPNPGRMRELLFPGVTVYVTPHENPKARTPYGVIGIEKGNDIFYLDTGRCNDVAAYMVQHQMIPGWEKYVLLRREVTMGDSRFDLLLGDPESGEVFPVEVKSCSLAGEKGAMFPDAPTERGTKHLLHLASIGKEGGHAGLLVLVHYGRAQWFLPDFHTDPDFAKAFCENLPYIDWKAAVISWTPEFVMPESTRLLPTSQAVLEREMGDRGIYFLVLHLEEEKEIEIGNQGTMHFPKGYYVYVGAAKENLTKQMNSHRRLRKQIRSPVDAIRQVSSVTAVLPIRSGEDLRHQASSMMRNIADWTMEDFQEGSISYPCLFGFHENPIHLRGFTKVEETLGIDRLERQLEVRS